jgi:hypothetical protein
MRSTGFRGSGPRSRVQAVLFEKALTLSDTSHLGRIVLPKVSPRKPSGAGRATARGSDLQWCSFPF